MQIRELDLKELFTAYEVVSQLRIELSYKEFEDLIYDMRYMDYKMFGIMEGEELITYAGIVIQTTLKDKRHLRVFDFITDNDKDVKKYDAIMLEYLNDYAKIAMCEKVLF
jgi:hypothetical protein